jgi:hypothetical protein
VRFSQNQNLKHKNQLDEKLNIENRRQAVHYCFVWKLEQLEKIERMWQESVL